MDIRIEPLDTLFFRDGKPFTMGQESWADSYLLPPPSVVYGAMRTAIAIGNAIPFPDVPTKLDAKTFRIISLHYKVSAKTVLPLPLDLVESDKAMYIQELEEEEKEYEVKPLILVKRSNTITKSEKKAKYHLLAEGWGQVENLDNGFIIATELEKYLNGYLPTTKALKLRDFVPNEPKVGNGRDDLTHSVEESLLYRTDMKRSDGLQIGVGFDLDGYKEIGSLVRLGGEGKLAHLSANRTPFRAVNQSVAFKQNRFKIYFSTPAILKTGEPDLSGLGIRAELVAACVGKPVHIGGFDMAQGRPKPMYKAVPAGSVFYYESKSEVNSLNQHQGISLSDFKKEEGFGIAYFGTWDIASNG